MAEDRVNISGSSSEDELSDPATQPESTEKDAASGEKEDETVCEDNQGSPLWKALQLVLGWAAWFVVEYATVRAIGPEERNRCRDRIIRENAEIAAGDTTATDSGPTANSDQNGPEKEGKSDKKEKSMCNIL